MQLTANNFDLWIFRRNPSVEYLPLKISQEKANRFFNGGRFWQISTDALADGEGIEDATVREYAAEILTLAKEIQLI
ncbi:MAG: hypothetical protein ACI9EW_003389 [Cellvibrionaceae bacterium]|jgi:hypothetical protein